MTAIEEGQLVASVRPVHRFKPVIHEAGYRYVRPTRFGWLADRVYLWLMRIGALKRHQITEQIYDTTEYRSADAIALTNKVVAALRPAEDVMWPLRGDDFVVVCGPEDLMEVRKELAKLALNPIEFIVGVHYGTCTQRRVLGQLAACVGVRVMVLPYVRGMVAVPKYLIERVVIIKKEEEPCSGSTC